MKKNTSLVFLSLFLLFSCKKYPNGPTFSLRSPIQRIVGAWSLKSYLINGNDSTVVFNNYTLIPGIDLNDPGLSDTSSYLIRGGVDSAYYVTNIGWYEFKNKKTELVLIATKVVNDLNMAGPLISSSVVTYKILRLTKKELWLQTEYNERNYELHYERAE